ncbi:putative membrane protein [Ruegeria sp. THAF57]|uniref:bestrophin family protein n=1 Tax=Ruegeria sp. THAF57 TaxID=2744555 RepID=UPI0015DEB751|nr:bestrophin family ion channel [Ruegeria sp. THAF57]CAD0183331.1 putative membrane protein [Ruegeria sp. THAF57]
MLLHDSISVRKLLRGSVGFISIVLAWILLVQVVDELTPVDLISNPSPPVAMLGIAVAFFLGFKNTSAYGRWTEARRVWGDIANASRDWGNTVATLVQTNGSPLDANLRTELIERHIAWVTLLAYQLRQPSANGRSVKPWMFGHTLSPSHTPNSPGDWKTSQLEADLPRLDGKANKAAYLLNLQARKLSEMAQQGKIDPFWHVALMDRLARLTAAQGQCERIKNTPFPRQVAEVGRLFSWIFIFMLPLAFNDERSIVAGTNTAMIQTVLTDWLTFAPVGALVCWIFFVTERVSASMEDPFEGDVTDVPILALCRTIEIDMRQATDCGVVPDPVRPVNKTLF